MLLGGFVSRMESGPDFGEIFASIVEIDPPGKHDSF
jgi:hypothetical protein